MFPRRNVDRKKRTQWDCQEGKKQKAKMTGPEGIKAGESETVREKGKI